MIARRLGIVCLSVLLATTALARRVDVDCPNANPCRFGGLADQLGPGSTLKLLVVHGMGSHTPEYSDELIERVAESMRLVATGDVERIEIPSVSFPHEPSLLRIRTFADAPRARELIVYELTWAPVIDTVKRERLGYDASREMAARRVRINNALKVNLMDQRLADPVLYLGPFGDEMRHPIKQAICRMLRGKETKPGQCDLATITPDDAGVAFITYSLGSRMTFDAITEIAMQAGAAEHVAIADLVARTSHIYMLANQLPLLDLGTGSTSAGGLAAAPSSLMGVLSVRSPRSEGGLLSPLMVVAFSDPNDLLSYSISSEFAKRHPSAIFANVTPVLARRWLGLFANPMTAHTAHDRSGAVIDLVVRGH